jgi:tetratricopeptide (TPR) repeat protein
MEITTEQYNRIQLFLDAEMTKEEIDAFELELDSNPSMRSQLDFEQNVRDNFAMQKKVPLIVENKKVIRINNRRKWLPMVAAASVLMAIGTLFFWNTKKNKATPSIAKKIDTILLEKKDTSTLTKPILNKIKNEINFAQLFDDYFEVEKIPTNYPIQLADAFSEYKKGNYASMQKLDITKITETRGVDDKQAVLELACYYKGISLLKLGKPEDAIKNFEWVKNNASTDSLKGNASWYLGLVYLKKGEREKAKVLLEGISSYGRYKNSIKELLNELE